MAVGESAGCATVHAYIPHMLQLHVANKFIFQITFAKFHLLRIVVVAQLIVVDLCILMLLCCCYCYCCYFVAHCFHAIKKECAYGFR